MPRINHHTPYPIPPPNVPWTGKKVGPWWAWYSTYLKSIYWKAKRAWYLKRAKFRCEACGFQGGRWDLRVHHKTYIRVGKELPEDVVVWCETCHDKEHGKKRILPVVDF